MPSNLQEWLTHISRVHPREIELGLGRVQCIAQAMSLSKPSKVITVAGTNGKGSVVSVMESLLCHAGISVGAYTSPHLHCFNERIRLQGLPCDEDLICEAFSEIDAIRGEVSLSYFEFATLAALWIFRRKRVSVALLEVGLGGRLDAVNILDPDVSVITAVGLDHQDWLGDSREEIGLEKAGILRQGGILSVAILTLRYPLFAKPESCPAFPSIRAENSDFELTSSLKRRNGGVLSLMAAICVPHFLQPPLSCR